MSVGFIYITPYYQSVLNDESLNKVYYILCTRPSNSTSNFRCTLSLYSFSALHGVASHLCNIDPSMKPWFEPFCIPNFQPKANELKVFSCWIRTWFVPFSSLQNENLKVFMHSANVTLTKKMDSVGVSDTEIFSYNRKGNNVRKATITKFF